MRLIFEPGRLIVANAGVLLTRVIRIKRAARRPPFIVVDAAMNDLMRPALYDAWHGFEAVHRRRNRSTANIVGPVCETGDTFARDREWTPLRPATSSSSALRAPTARRWPRLQQPPASSPEVLVDGDKWAVVADRILPETIFAAERVPEWLN